MKALEFSISIRPAATQSLLSVVPRPQMKPSLRRAPKVSTGHFSGCTPTVSVWPRIRMGFLCPFPFQTRDQVGAVWFEREDLRADAFAVEDFLQVINHGGLVARWIAGINPDNRLVVEENFRLHLFPIHYGLGGDEPEAPGRSIRAQRPSEY